MIEFSVATVAIDDTTFRVRVAGEVDLATSPELKGALAKVIDSGADGVLVDLSEATFIDSTTLGVLMGAVKRLRSHGGELVIACHDAGIRRIFEITLLDRIFKIFDTADAGVAYFKQPRSPGSPDLSLLG